MPARSLTERIEILEQKVGNLESLPDRVAAVESQILQLRSELKVEFLRSGSTSITMTSGSTRSTGGSTKSTGGSTKSKTTSGKATRRRGIRCEFCTKKSSTESRCCRSTEDAGRAKSIGPRPLRGRGSRIPANARRARTSRDRSQARPGPRRLDAGERHRSTRRRKMRGTT